MGGEFQIIRNFAFFPSPFFSSAEVISDIESMSYDWGSSWVYEQILTFHVRFARATPENALRFGGRPKQTSSNSFHPSIAPTFRSLVLDPEDFINETGHCLAVSIILTILIRFEKVPSTSVRKYQITELLRHLRYQQFLQPKTKQVFYLILSVAPKIN